MTIGQRNNNPLNIRRGKTLWKGEAPQALPQRGNRPLVAERLGSVSDGGQSGEGAFCRFSSVEWGIRAAFCLLRTYRNKYKAVCIEDIITRWAPPSENDTRAYIEAVCRLTGFGGKERLTESQWPRLVKAMAVVESRWQLTAEQLQKGWELYRET